MSDEEALIGIDLGTTNSVVGYWKDGKPVILTNSEGNTLTPSYVSFTNDEILVGDIAKTKHISNPENTLYDMKRLLGKRIDHPDIQQNLKFWTFNIAEDNGGPVAVVNQKNEKQKIRPEVVSAHVLAEMKRTAETMTRKTITKAVITVPAYFDQFQRIATLEAARLAGLEVPELVFEPCAAAYAYGFDKKEYGKNSPYNILVFDFGGGTLDVVILNVNQGKFKMISVGGDCQLGGRDIDVKIMDHIRDVIFAEHEIDVYNKKKWVQRLNSAVVEAKKQLSNSTRTEIYLEHIVPDLEDEEIDFTRDQLEAIIAPILQRIEAVVQDAIENAKHKSRLKADDIHEILLVGGSSRIPAVKKLLEKIFPGKKLNESINLDTAVAFGATVKAAQLSSSSNEVPDMFLLEATPISIGGMLYDGVFDPIIPRNTILPTKKYVKVYETTKNDQSYMRFEFFEGERKMARLNNYLGSFTLDDISSGMAGSQAVALTTYMDKHGVFHAIAKHGAKKKEFVLDYKAVRAVDKNPSELLQEAQENRVEDRAVAKKTEITWNITILIEQIQYKLREYRGEDNYQIAQKCDQMKTWLDLHQDAEMKEYRQKLYELHQTSIQIYEFNKSLQKSSRSTPRIRERPRKSSPPKKSSQPTTSKPMQSVQPFPQPPPRPDCCEGCEGCDEVNKKLAEIKKKNVETPMKPAKRSSVDSGIKNKNIPSPKRQKTHQEAPRKQLAKPGPIFLEKMKAVKAQQKLLSASASSLSFSSIENLNDSSLSSVSTLCSSTSMITSNGATHRGSPHTVSKVLHNNTEYSN